LSCIDERLLRAIAQKCLSTFTACVLSQESLFFLRFVADCRPLMKYLRYAFALLPLVGLGELGAHFYFAKRPPSEADWRAIRPSVLAMRQPNDLVVTSPRWTDPIARMTLGEALMPVRDVARADESRYAYAVEVSIFGVHPSSLSNWHELSKTKSGKFTMRRLQNPAYVPVVADFVERVDAGKAEVFVVDGQKAPCPWSTNAPVYAGGLGGAPTFPSNRFVCTAPSHVFAGVTVIDDENFLPRRCVMMHVPDRGSIEARFDDVPLGSEIFGHSGMRWIIERDLTGTPIRLEVFLDGEKIGDEFHNDGQGWKSFRFPTPGRAGTKGSLLFKITSPNASRRQMCWEATTR
jgi:hypothetical protein